MAGGRTYQRVQQTQTLGKGRLVRCIIDLVLCVAVHHRRLALDHLCTPYGCVSTLDSCPERLLLTWQL